MGKEILNEKHTCIEPLRKGDSNYERGAGGIEILKEISRVRERINKPKPVWGINYNDHHCNIILSNLWGDEEIGPLCI